MWYRCNLADKEGGLECACVNNDDFTVPVDRGCRHLLSEHVYCVAITFKMTEQTYGQDGSVGGYTVPPWTTKKSTKTNLSTKNNQNWQEMELYGSLTTKDLKKKHSSRPVGGAGMGSRAERPCGKAAAVGPGPARWWLADWVVPHLHVEKSGGTAGEWDRPCNPGFHCRDSKPLEWKNLWGLRQRDKLSASQESLLERPTGS